jgi:hypothetical protein
LRAAVSGGGEVEKFAEKKISRRHAGRPTPSGFFYFWNGSLLPANFRLTRRANRA